ncbi:MAG TPA: glycoside hydrolase family 2 TIM barrel-domain containing protein, partial [Acidobacteriota bacterium]
VKEPGEAIAGPGFDAAGWYPASLPATVMAVLMANGIYKDIFFAKTLQSIPEAQFKGPWWYRQEFELPRTAPFTTARLIFEGINYRANIFLNGEKIAAADRTFGAFRVFELNVSDLAMTGRNYLAVEVLPPLPGEPTIGFVDWNPKPPDRNMGIFRPVKVKLSGPVSLDHPFVSSQVDTRTLKEAKLTVTASLTNYGETEARGTVQGEIGNITFSQPYALKPGASAEVTFTPEQFPQLVVPDPRLWWPAGMGDPELYDLHISALVDGAASDEQGLRFGIRQVGDYLNAQGHRGYTVNGRQVLIRGGGWVDDLLLREDDKNLEAQVRYTRHMNLNTIRMEGIWGSSQKIFDLCDRYGILLMVGWSCQWEWEDYLGKPQESEMYGAAKTPEDMELLGTYFHDQVLWLRRHPSIFVWVVGSDKLPWPEMEKRYRRDLPLLDPSRPLLTSCKTWISEVSGSSAVKMNGPYDYVTPNYWYMDKENGGAFGFNTETGPGPQPPPLESLKKMIPADRLWPINDVWDFHCARNEFAKMDRYMLGFNQRYGPSRDAADFSFRAQADNYEGMRAMFEAFAANRPLTTGIIQWMHNAAWPKLFWQFYDYFLMPTGAFYGARQANRPQTLIYNYGDNGVYLANQSLRDLTGLQAAICAYDIRGKLRFKQTITMDAPANASRKVFDLPKIKKLGMTWFLDLQLRDGGGNPLTENFYWLSAKPDVLDYGKSEWFYTPCKEWADLTALNGLPPAAVQADYSLADRGAEKEITVTLRNPGKNIAFFIELAVRGETSRRTIVPVFWEDNYVSLLPGTSKTIRATFASADLDGEKPVFSFKGWNVKGE